MYLCIAKHEVYNEAWDFTELNLNEFAIDHWIPRLMFLDVWCFSHLIMIACNCYCTEEPHSVPVLVVNNNLGRRDTGCIWRCAWLIISGHIRCWNFNFLDINTFQPRSFFLPPMLMTKWWGGGWGVGREQGWHTEFLLLSPFWVKNVIEKLWINEERNDKSSHHCI